jgi:hypothetical protein
MWGGQCGEFGGGPCQSEVAVFDNLLSTMVPRLPSGPLNGKGRRSRFWRHGNAHPDGSTDSRSTVLRDRSLGAISIWTPILCHV